MSSRLSPPRLPLSCWHRRSRREWWQGQEPRQRKCPRMETLEMSADPRAWEAGHCEALPAGRACVGGMWQVWQVLWTSAETLQDQVELTWYRKAMARATLTSHKYPFMQNGSKLHKIRVQLNYITLIIVKTPRGTTLAVGQRPRIFCSYFQQWIKKTWNSTPCSISAQSWWEFWWEESISRKKKHQK